MDTSLLALLLVVAVGCARVDTDDTAARRARETGFRGIVLQKPVEKADFTLTDTQGRLYHFRERTDGHLTLLFFGYTHCPDICPVHMANIASVLTQFPHDVRSRVRVIFVTTDPERDTADRLRAWLDQFDPSFVGLSGGLDEVNRIQHRFNLPAAFRDDADAGVNYMVGHSAQVLAFTPDDVGRVTYPFGTRQVDWMHDLPKLLEQDGSDR